MILIDPTPDARGNVMLAVVVGGVKIALSFNVN